MHSLLLSFSLHKADARAGFRTSGLRDDGYFLFVILSILIHSGLLSIMMTISKELPCMDRFGGGSPNCNSVSSKISPSEIALTRLST